MRYKKFGKTDMNMSVLTIGTWALGGSADWGSAVKEDCIAAMHAMMDNGVNSVDTAPGYNYGKSEIIVGEAIKGRRDKMYVTTKTALYSKGDEQYFKDGRYDSVISLCETSLKNLQTDYIDLMLIHWPDNNLNTPIEETMRALEDLKKAGKIRYAGVSNFSVEQIKEALAYGELVANEPQYSMVNRTNEDLMLWCYDNGIANMTYGSLGAGILTGAIRELPKFGEGDMRLVFYDFFVEPKFSKVMSLLKVLDEIAAAHNAPVAQVAVNWNAQKDYVQTALCGVRNVQEANENCKGLEWELTSEEMATIDKAIAEKLA